MVADTELHAGALRLPGVLMQGLTHMAPATGLLLTIQFTTSQAGMAAPLAYLVAFMDYTQDDIARPAAIPGWSGLNVFLRNCVATIAGCSSASSGRDTKRST